MANQLAHGRVVCQCVRWGGAMVMVAMAVDAMVAAWGVRRGGGAGCPGAQVQLVRAVLTVAVAVAVSVVCAWGVGA